jgi:hypothetical protein
MTLSVSTPIPPEDPVLARRRQMGRLAGTARRIGWALLAVAVLAFIAGVVIGLSVAFVVIVMASLIAASVLLLPAIVIGFGVSAADRDEGRARRRGGH